MSKYTFTFKKDDIIVDFSTTDKEIVERQFQLWVANADEYAKRNKPRYSSSRPTPPIKEERPKPEPKREEKPGPKVEIKQEIKAEVKPKVQPEVSLEPQEGVQEVFDKASSLLKTINSIQTEMSVPEPVEEKAPEVPVFEDVLEKTIENPTFEPVRVKDPIFLNLVSSKNTTDKFHYLMITAYYLSEFEKLERFSIKQINAKLMHNLSEVIDHGTLQEAINQNFIEFVPDLTGSSEVGEYRITTQGEDFFANRI